MLLLDAQEAIEQLHRDVCQFAGWAQELARMNVAGGGMSRPKTGLSSRRRWDEHITRSSRGLFDKWLICAGNLHRFNVVGHVQF